MTRHPFRWDSLAFGALFLAVVGNWAVWDQDILTPRELSVAASVALIVFGVLGILVSLRSKQESPAPKDSHAAPATTTDNLEPADTPASPEGNENEEVDPQS